MGIRDFFKKDFETSDNSIYQTLKTHYYRNRYDEVKEVIFELIKEEKGNLQDENDQYQEILFETSGYSCIIKITSTTPIEHAIDFKVNTYNLLGFGKGKKVIERLYSILDSHLQFKGIALFKG